LSNIFYESMLLPLLRPSVTFIYEATGAVLGASKLSGIVAHDLSGLKCHVEVTDETDRMATGDPEDAI
jgi:hypothetical protein